MRIGFISVILLLLMSCMEPSKPIASRVTESMVNVTGFSLKERTLVNKTAYIPPQCYTKTRDENGAVQNPCYSCHTESRRPNFINDSDLQLIYSFPTYALNNHWQNLFKDRRSAISDIDEKEIVAYISADNYLNADGSIRIAEKLRQLPVDWDYDGNGIWEGYVPDAYFNFDDEGFDRKPNGDYTGWRAFAYYPFPGSFFPTNGSTDDVLIRLPAPFQTDDQGRFNLAIYKTNLAIVESMLKEKDIAIEPVDEAALGRIDLDKNGVIGTAEIIRYDWAPLQKRFMWYVGKAYEKQKAGQLHLAAGLFPEGTEFLHTVRYIDVDRYGNNLLTPRMKEVRYARKRYWVNYADLERDFAEEIKEEYDFPDRLPVVRGNIEAGISNGQGWVYSGFIEDSQGELRPQTYEELNYCFGCHSRIGATRDGIFSFQRKPDDVGAGDNWYHWSQKGLRGMPDRIRSDGEAEYAFYLKNNHAGDEFRANQEVIDKFFGVDGSPVPEMFSRLHQNVSVLLFASPQRAMQLNKAYRLIVKEQSFIEGRDAIISPPGNIQKKLDEGTETGVETLLKGY